ncbi:MAG: hypothetical protein LBD33_01760 [Puniceicoccales bacterium]|nr:hypothetical protein [Puniceicoccales bacterium]
MAPVFGDTSAAPAAYLGVVKVVNDFIGPEAELQKRNQEALFRANYNNAAQQAAVEAYNANPSDMEGYKRVYRESMGKIDVPLSRQARAGAISANVEAQYFWTINQNHGGQIRENLKSALEREADDYAQSGISFMDVQLADPAPAVSACQGWA